MMTVDGEGIIERAFQAHGDFGDFGTIAHARNQHCEFVSAEACEHISRAKLVGHTERYLLQVDVSDLMAVAIVDLLEPIQVDINQAECAGVGAALRHHFVEVLVQREAVIDIGELVELGAAQQIGVKAAGFNGKGCELGCEGESFGLDRFWPGALIEGGKDGSERRSGAGKDLVLNDAKTGETCRAVAQHGSIGDLAPTWRTTQFEGNKLGNAFDDLSEWARPVDIHEDAIASLFDMGQGRGLSAHLALNEPSPGPNPEDNNEQNNYKLS